MKGADKGEHQSGFETMRSSERRRAIAAAIAAPHGDD